MRAGPLIVFCLLLAYYAMASEQMLLLETKIRYLENQLKSSADADKAKLELSELYFLTSRCVDLVRLYSEVQTESAVYCSCVDSCGDDFSLYKKSLRVAQSWNNQDVQLYWSKVNNKPEAYYWAVKFLQNHDLENKSLQNLRKRFERALQEIE